MNNDSIRCGGQISCVLKWENTVTEVYNGHKRKKFTNKRKTRIFFCRGILNHLFNLFCLKLCDTTVNSF